MCSLLLCLHSACINDLIVEIKQAGTGVRLYDFTLGAFLFADNVVLLAVTEQDIGSMLINIIHGGLVNGNSCKKNPKKQKPI